MEQRVQALDTVRSRVQQALASSCTTDVERVAVALAAAAPRDSADLNGMILNRRLALVANKAGEAMAITSTEFSALFGNQAVVVPNAQVTSAVASPDFRAIRDRLQHALRCTLVEPRAREAWERPGTQLACYLALHATDAEDRIGLCLGGIVRGDSRRLDDVRASVEDDGADHMLLTSAVLALAASVCRE